jgi:PAS domain S-box-containing protein
MKKNIRYLYTLLPLKAFLISVILGCVAVALFQWGIQFHLAGLGSFTDAKEVLISLSSAFTGPVGGAITAFLSTIVNPYSSYRIFVVIQHVLDAIFFGWAYKKIIYEKYDMPFMALMWALFMFVYYYVVNLPGFIFIYLYKPAFWLILSGNDASFWRGIMRLYDGWFPEFCFSTFITMLILIALPEKYRLPHWGKRNELINRKSAFTNKIFNNSFNRYFNKFAFNNYLGIRLSLWFIILSFIPLILVGFFMRNYIVEAKFHEQADHQYDFARSVVDILKDKSSDEFVNKVTEINFDEMHELAVCDKKMNLILTDKKDSDDVFFYNRLTTERKNEIAKNKRGSFIDETSNFVVGYSYVPKLGFYLFSVTKKWEQYSALNNLTGYIYKNLGIALLGVSILSGFIIWILVGIPLKKLTLAVKEMGDRNSNVILNPDDMTDEVAALAVAFNDMKLKINSAYEKLRRELNQKINLQKDKLRYESEFKTITEHMFDVVVLTDIKGMMKYVTPSFTNTFGYELNEIEHENLFNKVHIDDLKKVIEAFELLLRKSHIEAVEFRVLCKNGKYAWIEVNGNVVKNERNDIESLVISIRNINDRKKSEETIGQTMRYIEYIINAIPVVIISVDKDLNVTHYNKSAEKYFQDGEEANRYSFILEKFKKLHFIKELILQSQNSIELVRQNITSTEPDGRLKNLNVSIYPLSDEINPGRVIMVEDVTERKKIEEMMIQTEKMMSVGGLAAGMAHEINNPLGTIVQGCQNIVRRTSPELQKNIDSANQLGISIDKLEAYFTDRQIYEIIDSIKNAAEKAAGIIRNMLQFSRRSESKNTICNPVKLIDDVLQLATNDYDLKKKYDLRNIKIEKNYDVNLSEISVTVTEIEQVIFNIIKNAVQALKNVSEPKITIRLKNEPGNLIIEIEDNGPGIDENTKRHVFEPFFTTKEVGEGTGLGLSVSYMIITSNHRGSLSLESSHGNGANFIIKLPTNS